MAGMMFLLKVDHFQRSRSYINLDNVKIFTTPRNLVRSLHASNELPSDFSDNQSQRGQSSQSQSSKSPLLTKFDLNHTPKYDLCESFTHDDEQFYDTTESVSSTEDICQEFIPETKATLWFSGLQILCGLNVLFAIIGCFLLVGDSDEGYNLVRT
ncbi:hypothetical protein R6Q59_007689 [Mikania micrantha]